MTITPAEILLLVDKASALLQDARVVAHIRSLIIDPTKVDREWDYGDPGQLYSCWDILKHVDSNTGIAYCEFGFGPRSPWGLVSLFGENMSMGMDCGWYVSFIEAYFESMASADLPIWRVFKYDEDTRSNVAMTDELGWDSTWEEVYRLRSIDPNGCYNCLHSIQFARE